MTRNRRILDELTLMAQDVAKCGGSRMAAAVVYRRRIVAYGFNGRKTSPFQKRFGRNEESIAFHAETCAIRNAINRMGETGFLRQSTLLVARAKIVDGVWQAGLAKPCGGCWNCIDTFGIRCVEWTGDV